MSKKISANEGVPQLSKMEKLEQIRSGKTLQRRKSRIDIKDIIVLSGKDGSKITKKEMAEKFEETTVKRKKKNYIMYESKLGTEKNTEITKIAGPKPKKAPRPVRTPAPRVEERIIQTKKRHEYLDNYQYHETKVLKRKNPSVVEHKRLGDIIYGEVEETTYQKQVLSPGKSTVNQIKTIRATGSANHRLPPNRTEKQLASTATDFYRRNDSSKSNTRNQKSNSKDKSHVVTNQIMLRKGAPQTYETKTENKKTTNSRTRIQARTPAPQNQNTSLTRTNTKSNDNDSRKRMHESVSTKTITTSTSVRRRGNNDNSGTKTETTVETKVIKKVNGDDDKDKGNSIRKKYQRK